MKLIFYIQLSVEVSYKLMLWFMMGMVKQSQSSQISKFVCLYNISKNILQVKFTFFMQTNIKVSYKLISTLLASEFPTR